MTITKMYNNGTVGFANAEIRYRNFEGREGDYNKEGDRSFVVLLKPSDAEKLEAEGWNIRWPKPQEDRDDVETRSPYLKVSVAFDKFPAQIYLITVDDDGNVIKTEQQGPETVAILDWTEFSNIELVIRPYDWTVRGESGKKAYLKNGYFTPLVDEFAAKYGI